MASPERRHLALVGPTASGKTALALALAQRLGDVEIVSADAMQVYRGMDAGTAKPTPTERAAVPHHLIDVADPAEDWTVARHQAAARAAVAGIEARGRRALLVGGTGLYVRAIVDELDLPGTWPGIRAELDAELDAGGPDALTRLHARLAELDPIAATRMLPTNRRRIVRALEVTLGSGRPFSSYGPGLAAHPPARFDQVGLRVPRDVLDARIEGRVDAMLAAGLVDEVRGLVDRRPAGSEPLAGRAAPAGLSRTARQALGYKEVLAHLDGACTLEAARHEIVRRTRAFARRQDRWFRRDPRIRWVDHTGNPLAVLDEVLGDWSASCAP